LIIELSRKKTALNVPKSAVPANYPKKKKTSLFPAAKKKLEISNGN